MRKLSFVFLLGGLLSHAHSTLAQQAAKPVYLQIFYEGSGWLAGREVLHYSPAFRGKAGEVIREDSTQAIAPGALVFSGETGVVTSTMQSVTTEQGTFVRGADGKMRPQTADDIRKRNLEQNARFNRSLSLVETRATMARTALAKALNDTAADGWEVIQMTAWGTQGGLVYLLRRR